MPQQFFAVYLNPSRPDFATTMTEAERAIMHQHLAYWNHLMDQGKVYAFGPVMTPQEVYGLGIVGVKDEQELQVLIAEDPASLINSYEYYPMRAVVPTHQK